MDKSFTVCFTTLGFHAVLCIFALALPVCAQVDVPSVDSISSDRIPPAPVPPQSLNPLPQDSIISTASNPLSVLNSIKYDLTQSFEINLSNLQVFCSQQVDNPTGEMLTWRFFEESTLHRDSTVIANNLVRGSSSPLFTSILLGLAFYDLEFYNPDLLWNIALNPGETVNVRKTAVYLLSQYPNPPPSPEKVGRLLRDESNEIVNFSLALVPYNLDQHVYDECLRIFNESGEILNRCAALDAVGASGWPGSQDLLLSVVNQAGTSRLNMFSDLSLLKRSAICHLNVASASVSSTIKRIIEDETEDSGVRSAAIKVVKIGYFPDAGNYLSNLIVNMKSDELMEMKVAIMMLSESPEKKHQQIILNKIDSEADPVAKDLLKRAVQKQEEDIR